MFKKADEDMLFSEASKEVAITKEINKTVINVFNSPIKKVDNRTTNHSSLTRSYSANNRLQSPTPKTQESEDSQMQSIDSDRVDFNNIPFNS